ncbi:MAG: hypothetical protein IJJ77_02440 [Paludibacteraceae bacterium]|nr:hypothetical protein [Paludibacteraceae bacterium]
MMKIPSILHSNAAHKGGVSEENKLGMEVFGGQSNAPQTVPISSESDNNKFDNI